MFGDIGTNPLYSLHTDFSTHHNAVAPTEADVFGVISMVTRCLVTIVAVTYIGLIIRADTQGEGGVLALIALVLRKLSHDAGRRKPLAVLALFPVYARQIRRWPIWRIVAMDVIVGGLELALLVANIIKIPELAFDPDDAVYYLSVFRIGPGSARSVPRWQKVLFRILEQASANRAQALGLPPHRTIVMGAETVL